MKKVFLMLCFIIGFLVIPVTVIFAASQVGEKVFGVDGIEGYFISLAALAAVVVPATEFIKRILKSSGGWTKFLSWIVSIGLAFAGWYFDFGVLADLDILFVVIYGVAAGLVANAVFDIEMVKGILKALKGKTKDK